MYKLLVILLAVLGLTACGGGATIVSSASISSSSSSMSSSSSVSSLVPNVASVILITSSPELPSDDSSPVTLTALVLDNQNRAVQNVPIQFEVKNSTTSIGEQSGGYITSVDSVTNSNGVQAATLHALGKTNRTLEVTATYGTASGKNYVNVVGTKLSVSGPEAATVNDPNNYVVTLLDAGNKPIANTTINFSSLLGNTVSPASANTDSKGQASVRFTGINPTLPNQSDELMASALGAAYSKKITISDSYKIEFVSESDQFIPLNTPKDIKIKLTKNNVLQTDATIIFSTIRGQVSSNEQPTKPNGPEIGIATVSLSSNNAGVTKVSAYYQVDTNTRVTAEQENEFIATVPDQINLQAQISSVATKGSSTITATVWDANKNLIKGQNVLFSLVDTSGGKLSASTATTDSLGRAQVIYTASDSTSTQQGVKITGKVFGTNIQDTTSLTVGGQSLFISLGTGNDITEGSSSQYSVPYVIQVTDANGNGVANATLNLQLSSLWYAVGTRAFDTTTSRWKNTINGKCKDEDTLFPGTTKYRNGVLDQGEDQNLNLRLDAGNIATVTPGNVITDENGFADVNVVYPQEYAEWLYIELRASTFVVGTEASRATTFWLPIRSSDYSQTTKTTPPPGLTSPFGEQAICPLAIDTPSDPPAL